MKAKVKVSIVTDHKTLKKSPRGHRSLFSELKLELSTSPPSFAHFCQSLSSHIHQPNRNISMMTWPPLLRKKPENALASYVKIENNHFKVKNFHSKGICLKVNYSKINKYIDCLGWIFVWQLAFSSVQQTGVFTIRHFSLSASSAAAAASLSEFYPLSSILLLGIHSPLQLSWQSFAPYKWTTQGNTIAFTQEMLLSPER